MEKKEMAKLAYIGAFTEWVKTADWIIEKFNDGCTNPSSNWIRSIIKATETLAKAEKEYKKHNIEEE